MSHASSIGSVGLRRMWFQRHCQMSSRNQQTNSREAYRSDSNRRVWCRDRGHHRWRRRVPTGSGHYHDRQRAINSGGGKECMDEVASAWNKRRLGSRIRASSLRRSMCRTTSAFPLTRSRPRRSVMGSLGNAIHSLKPHRDWVLRVNFVLPASPGMAARCTSDLRLWRLP